MGYDLYAGVGLGLIFPLLLQRPKMVYQDFIKTFNLNPPSISWIGKWLTIWNIHPSDNEIATSLLKAALSLTYLCQPNSPQDLNLNIKALQRCIPLPMTLGAT